jgi:hypothetical protein
MTVAFTGSQIEWIKSEREKLTGIKRKGKKCKPQRAYMHFDRFVALSDGFARDVINPKIIARHSFLPFISFEKITRKWEKAQDGSRRISKKPKVRNIRYAAHTDAIIFSWYAHLMGTMYEIELGQRGLNEVVVAFRKGPGPTYETVAEVIEFILNRGECSVLCFDIHGYYDNIDGPILKHKWLELIRNGQLSTQLPTDHYKIWRRHTNIEFIDLKKLRKHLGIKKGQLLPESKYCSPERFREIRGTLLDYQKTGIPQGSPLSPLLSNLYLMEFDEIIHRAVKASGGLYRRYCDDIIIVCPHHEKDNFQQLVCDTLRTEKLELKVEKTEILEFVSEPDGLHSVDIKTNHERNLQYLGIEFNGRNAYIRSSTVARFYRRLSHHVKFECGRYKYRKNVKKLPGPFLRKRRLYEKFTDLGKQNFLSYCKSVSQANTKSKIDAQINGKKAIKIVKRKIGYNLLSKAGKKAYRKNSR